MGEYNIGQFIYRSRKAVGLTQEELCYNEFGEKCFSVETLSRIECGKQRPNYRTMHEIMRRLGKENCFCTPYLKTADYRVLEMKRRLKREITLNNYSQAENLLEQMEQELSLEYITNRQYLIRTHALIDQQLGHISVEEALELMEEALKMTVHSYGTRLFSYEVLLPEEIVIVCNIASCYGKLKDTDKAITLLQTVNNMLNDVTLQFNSYPSGLREMVNRNLILWIGEEGKHREAIIECDRAIEECLKRDTLNTLPGLYYARAYNMQKLRENRSEYPDWREDQMDGTEALLFTEPLYSMNEIKLDYIKCALLAELVHDRKGSEKALSALKKIIS